jgi:tetratricopeptide (TPR) repeat protein
MLVGIEPDDAAAESVRHMLAQAYRALDQPDEAIGQLEIIAESGARRAHPALVAEMSEQIGQLLDRLDRDALAAQRFAAASVAYAQADMPLESLRTARRRALSHMWAGQLDEAGTALEHADLAALDITDPAPAIRWERVMLGVDGARILAQRGDMDAAIFRSAPTIDGFTAIGDPNAAAFAAAIHGGFLVQAGRHSQAEPILRVAIAGGDDDARHRAALSLARALDMLGRADEAAEVRAAHGLDG